MCAYKDNSDADSIKKREYLKQQHQLRTMTKTNNALSADDMIENLLSKKEIFKMKKDTIPPKNSQANYPGWIYPGHEPALYKRVWDIVVTPTGFADTPKLTSLLLTSRLSTDVLGYIWSLSNISLAPALSQLETYTCLALISLVQSGYSFTSAAVLTTLKEAPLPKLDYPLTEGPVMAPGPLMMTNLIYSRVPPTNTLISPSQPSVPVQALQNLITAPVEPKPLDPGISPTVQSDQLNLLDLDLSLSVANLKTEVPKTSPAVQQSASILDKENSIDFTSEDLPPDYHAKLSERDIISEFSPTSSKNKGGNTLNSFSSSKVEHDPLVDDFFGDFQSVTVHDVKCIAHDVRNLTLDVKSTVNDEEEFDDFKSADFTPFTLLEVKEKPPEDEIVEKRGRGGGGEEKSGIEDLFPRCVLRSKEEMLAEEMLAEDRYSALRGLTEEQEEFGDFLTAAPTQPHTLAPPFTPIHINIQERAMEACLEILEEAVKIFYSVEKEDVLNGVITDPRGIQYLEELIEVERIALRLRSTMDKEDLKRRLVQASSSLEQYLKPHMHTYMAEEKGPKCGICLCERGPAYVKYGINNFHAPCANLYLHKVDSVLPIAPIM